MYRMLLFFLGLFFSSSSFATGEGVQTFSLDGRLYSDSRSLNPMLDSDVVLKIQILDPGQTCILYEESQSVVTTNTDGYFSVRVGSAVGSGKRTANDSGHAMSRIYSNSVLSLNGKALSGGAACPYAPAAGHVRYLRVTVTPSSDSAPRVLQPNMILDAVPAALVAERAETLQGLTPENLLLANSSGTSSLNQASLENVFSATNYNKLTTILNNGGGITSIVAGPGLTGGPISTSGQTISIDVGTAANKIVQLDASAKLPAVDGSALTNIDASHINSGTLSAMRLPTNVLYDGGNSPSTDLTVGTQNQNGLRLATGGVARLAVDGGGRVGVGTTSPAYKLDVSGPINATQLLVNGVDLTAGAGAWNVNGANAYRPSGNVGIGTMSPTTSLDVAGTLKAISIDSLDASVSRKSGGGIYSRGMRAQGTITLTKGSSTIIGNGTQFVGDGGPTSLSYWWNINVNGTTYYIDDVIDDTTAVLRDANRNEFVWTDETVTVPLYIGGGMASGEESVALGSYSQATNAYSFTSGWGTKATGRNSTAMGQATTASGQNATSIGYNTLASNESSLATGSFTKASGRYSTAMGENAEARAQASVAMGRYTIAIGDNSTAMGLSTKAASQLETVVGSYNLDLGGNPTDWVATDSLFVVGNGTWSTPSNAFTVLKNGKVGVGTASPTSLLTVNGAIESKTGGIKFPDGTIQTSAATASQWTTSGSNTILSAGKVGINTSNPLAPLDVNGKIASSGMTVVYNAEAAGFTGSLFFGDGGTLLSRTTGQQGYNNTGVGIGSLAANTTASGNTAIGTMALNKTTTGSGNTATGERAMFFNTTGSNNTANGSWALSSNTTGTYNTAVGVSALSNNTTASGNTAVGGSALSANTTGSSNTATGQNALSRNTTGAANAAFGDNSLFFNTTGYANTAVGSSALFNNTTGFLNTAHGNQALYSNTTGSYNTATGYYSLYEITTGSNNTAVGQDSGRFIANGSTANRTSNSSVYLGVSTKAKADGDLNEIVIGFGATGLGSNSVVLGNDSISTTALKGNVGIGTTTPVTSLDVLGGIRTFNDINGGVSVAARNFSTGAGANAGFIAGNSTNYGGLVITSTGNTGTFGADNTYVYGSGAGGLTLASLHSSGSVIIGAGGSGTLIERMRVTAAGNVGIGKTNPSQILDVNGKVAASGNVVIYNANSTFTGSMFYGDGGTALTNTQPGEGWWNTGVGIGSLYSITSGGQNSASGYFSLFATTTGSGNTAQGFESLKYNTTGASNAAVGSRALYSNSTGGQNTAIGATALYSNTTGFQNTATGNDALFANSGGYLNSAHGMQALYNNTSGSRNTANGYQALFSTTNGAQNTASGSEALFANTTGTNNSALGYVAGRYITDGSTANATSSNSVYLGANTKSLASGDTNEIVIGYNAIGLGSNSVVLGNDLITTTALKGKVGIGTTAPGALLHVKSNSSDVPIFENTASNSSSIYLKHGGGAAVLNATANAMYFRPAMASGDALALAGGGAAIGSYATSDSPPSNSLIVSGNVGIGTPTPLSKVQVNGAISNIVNTTSGTFTCGSSSINFSTSNFQRLSPSNTISAGTCNVALSNLVAGGSYTLVVTGNAATNAVTYFFTGYTFKYLPANAATTAGRDTIYTFLYDGTAVYVTWSSGYQ